MEQLGGDLEIGSILSGVSSEVGVTRGWNSMLAHLTPRNLPLLDSCFMFCMSIGPEQSAGF